MTDPSPPRPEVDRVYRCAGVVWSGAVWLAIGAALSAGGAVAVFARTGTEQLAIGLALLACGVAAGTGGVGLARSRLVITPSSLVSYWCYSRVEYRISSLVDATVTPPRSRADRSNGAAQWVPRPGGVPVVVMAGLEVLKVCWMAVRWALLPGSPQDQVLHLLPRVGGAVPIRPISARTNVHLGDAGIAFAAVRAAIGPPPLRRGFSGGGTGSVAAGPAGSPSPPLPPADGGPPPSALPGFTDWRWPGPPSRPAG